MDISYIWMSVASVKKNSLIDQLVFIYILIPSFICTFILAYSTVATVDNLTSFSVDDGDGKNNVSIQ